jgi:hypothetical protein
VPILHAFRADAIRRTINKQIQRADYSRADSPDRVDFDPLIAEMVADLVSFDRITYSPEVTKLPPLQVIDILAGAYYAPVEVGTRSNVELLLNQLGDLQGFDGKTLRWAQKYIGEQAGLSLANGTPYVTSKWVMDWLDRMLTQERQLAGEDPSKDKTTPPASKLGKLQVFLRNDLAKRRKRRLAQMVRISLQLALSDSRDDTEGGNLRQAYANRYLDIVERLTIDTSSVSAEDRNFVNKVEANLGVASSSRDSLRGFFQTNALEKRAAHTRQGLESGELKPGEKAKLPLEAFEPLRRAIDRTIASELSVDTATAILQSTAGKEGEKRRAGLTKMTELYGLTPEIAKAIADEVKTDNLLKELGDKDDY